MDARKSMALQYKIRENAMQQSDYFSDMSKWEKEMRKKDKQIRQKRAQQIDGALPPVRDGVRVGIRNANTEMPSSTAAQEPHPASKSRGADAAQHTYDKGYAKWEKFNVEAALASEEEDKHDSKRHDEPVEIAHPFLRAQRQAAAEVSEPLCKRMPATEDRDPEVLCVLSCGNELVMQAAQREVGNAAFARGDYAAAVKSYTICLGLKKYNTVAFSNRAMAYLKLKEYHNAEIDCTSALAIDSTHVKSLHRRAAARDALGKHRAALVDIQAALELQPANKALATESVKIHNHLKACAQAAPFTAIPLY